ncbi:MAG: hypothetical protein ACD_58C00122G0002 [uncultured bacterium]|nr:MAG: hypothetical protein ACD_58C00122G0002 [uncultured bacterium]
MAELYYKGLSYEINGYLFEMFNKVGFGYQEKHYQSILEEILKLNHVVYKKELCGKIIFNNRIIAKYFLDFLIDDKIVLELKVANDFYQQHINQVLFYLKAKNLKLGILAIITKNGIETKRIVN